MKYSEIFGFIDNHHRVYWCTNQSQKFWFIELHLLPSSYSECWVSILLGYAKEDKKKSFEHQKVFIWKGDIDLDFRCSSGNTTHPFPTIFFVNYCDQSWKYYIFRMELAPPPKNIYSLIDNWRKCEKMAEIGKNIRLDIQTRRSGRWLFPDPIQIQ